MTAGAMMPVAVVWDGLLRTQRALVDKEALGRRLAAMPAHDSKKSAIEQVTGALRLARSRRDDVLKWQAAHGRDMQRDLNTADRLMRLETDLIAELVASLDCLYDAEIERISAEVA
jgi:hypothetical protein